MRFLLLILLSVVYGLLFHAAMRACTLLFGAVPLESATAFPVRDVGYLAVSSFAAAAIVTAAWLWRHRRFALSEAFAVGAISVTLILANILAARGVEGLARMLATRPAHTAASFAFAFFAVPLCAWIASSSRRPDGARRGA